MRRIKKRLCGYIPPQVDCSIARKCVQHMDRCGHWWSGALSDRLPSWSWSRPPKTSVPEVETQIQVTQMYCTAFWHKNCFPAELSEMYMSQFHKWGKRKETSKEKLQMWKRGVGSPNLQENKMLYVVYWCSSSENCLKSLAPAGPFSTKKVIEGHKCT